MRIMILAIILMAAGAGLLGRDGYRRAKGAVATGLVNIAVDAHLADGAPHAPWSWADFRPRGRLHVPRLGVSRPVLEGGEGQTMAFGLGHVAGTAEPGSGGHVGLAGHRDSWGSFIGDLRPQDLLVLATAAGDRAYRVTDLQVVPCEDSAVLAPEWGPGLTLVTCHPVDGLLPTAMRLVVHAAPVARGGRPESTDVVGRQWAAVGGETGAEEPACPALLRAAGAL